MMTFKDNQKLINIRMQTIYFMLSEQERTQYKEVVEVFNRYKAFTLGLYEFKVLTKLGGVNSCLSADLTREIETNNLIVRLPNDVNDNFVYIFNNIDLSEDGDAVREMIHNYVICLAEQSIALMKERQSAGSDPEELASQIDNIVYSFEEAIKSGRRSYTRLTAPITVNECRQSEHSCHNYKVNTAEDDNLLYIDTSIAISEDCSDTAKLNCTNYPNLASVINYLGKHGIAESKQQLVARELADIFAVIFDIPTKEESKAIADGILDNKSDAILVDHNGRYKPSVKPDIKIYIERIPYIDGRGKKMREKYGVRICAGSFEQKICFEETTQRMVYIATLLKHKMGKRLYAHELHNNSAGNSGVREVAKQWLKKIYTTIISPDNSSFEKWIESVRERANAGRRLNNAISRTKHIITKGLEAYPDARYYSLMVSHRDSEKGVYYTLNCAPDDIIICGELQEAMRSVPNVY